MFENIVKLIDVIIWPLTVFIILLIMKKPIKNLIPLIKNIKYKDIEVAFTEEINQINEEAKEIGIKVNKTPEEIKKIDKNLDKLPTKIIIESWNDLEESVKNKVVELSKNEKRFLNPKERPFIYLENKGAINPATSRTIRNLMDIKNRINHEKDVNIKKEDAIKYSIVANEIKIIIQAIKELPQIKLTALTILILEINSLIDTKKYENIRIDEVHEAIKNKRIIKFLEERTKGDSDFSFFSEEGPYYEFVEIYNEQMYQIYGGYAGNERRKWGVENMGLCLLIAWTNEIIQRGDGWYPNIVG